MGIKNSIPRLDAVDKVTGAAKYTEDLIPINALVGKTLHSTIANGTVRAIDVDEAWKIPGVVMSFMAVAPLRSGFRAAPLQRSQMWMRWR